MSWEQRGNRRYYTRKLREGARIVREYIGRGPVAEAIAELDRIEREEREARWRAIRELRAELAAEDAPVAALHDGVAALMAAALFAEGCYRQSRTWRKRRG